MQQWVNPKLLKEFWIKGQTHLSLEELTELKIIKRKDNFIPGGITQPMKHDFLTEFY